MISATKIIRMSLLVLCAVFLIVVTTVSELGGDASGDTVISVPPGPGTDDDNTEALHNPGIDIDAAMSAFAPDTAMLSSGGDFVTWDLFYFYLHYAAAQITNNFQEPAEWSEPYYADGTLSEAVKDHGIDQGSQYLVLEYAYSIHDVELDESDFIKLQDMLDSMASDSGGLDNLERDLRSEGFFSLDTCERWLKNYILQDKLLTSLYGPSYVEIPDEAVVDYALSNGYMRAKHILALFPDESEELLPEEVEDAKQAAYDKLEGLLDELNEFEDDDDFADFFGELVAEYSEDPGSVDYPDGYLFQFTDMVEPFSAACEALDIGQMSGIVETPYGYHIILRLPLDYDKMVPFSAAGSGQNLTLRQLAVTEDYRNKLVEWQNSVHIERSPELETLDVAALFAWRD